MFKWIIEELKKVRWWLVLPIGVAGGIIFSLVICLAIY